MSDFDLESRPAFNFRQVRTAGEIVSDAITFIRQNLRELVVGLFAIIGIPALISLLISAFQLAPGQFDFVGMFQGRVDPDALETPGGPLLMGLSAGMSLITSFLFTAAIYGYIDRHMAGYAGQITPGLLWEATKPKIGTILGITAVTVGVFLAVGLGVALLIGVFGGAFALVAMLLVFGVLGFAVYLMPTLWIWPVTALSERSGVLDAFRRSRYLTAGYWGRGLGTLLLFLLIALLISMALGLPSAILLGAIGFTTGGDLGLVGRLAYLLLSVLLSVPSYLLYSLFYVGSAMYYFGLVELKDGPGLAQRIEAINDADDADLGTLRF